MKTIDWDRFDMSPLLAELREGVGGPDGEKAIWAFEQALRTARIDRDLLDYLLVAAVCLIARAEDVSPRDVLEAFFRRSVPDEEWRRRYRPLLA
ncbi:MAG: hypothetical protein ACRDVM_08845 [Acidimicrobiia bacterium]